MRTIAPAKINWTLEVLGRRGDGYHEIRSVMQTIDLCDEISADQSYDPIFETAAGKPLAPDDLIVRATKALEERVRRALPARIRVEKRIPVASGLGGGSSDAAAVLRLLNRLHDLGLSEIELAEVGASVGSDVPFFVYGGTALVEGRGERVTPLTDAAETWLVIGVPAISVANKTKRMYETLTPHNFTDGSWAEKAVSKIRGGAALEPADWYNAFQTRAYVMFGEPLMKLGDALLYADAGTFDVAGSGPAMWARVDSRVEAESLIQKVRSFVIGDFLGTEAKLIVARTLTRYEATAATDRLSTNCLRRNG